MEIVLKKKGKNFDYLVTLKLKYFAKGKYNNLNKKSANLHIYKILIQEPTMKIKLIIFFKVLRVGLRNIDKIIDKKFNT